jgi:hypothetical protein
LFFYLKILYRKKEENFFFIIEKKKFFFFFNLREFMLLAELEENEMVQYLMDE